MTQEINNDDLKTDSDEAVLAEAIARFAMVSEAETSIRSLALEDLKFRKGEQWPAEVENERVRDGRPCLVINKIPQFINQITNDQRQNRPSIKVHPIDDHADVETAKIIQGLVRHIEYNSNADVAYDTAFESAVIGGRGFFRIITQYSDPNSFEQEILIKRIRNPFSVFFDPHSQEPDGSDATFAIIVEDFSKDEFKAKYPKSKLTVSNDWSNIGNTAPGWFGEDSIRVAEYLVKRFEEKELVLLSNGETLLASELPNPLPDGIAVAKTRTTLVPVVKWYKFNGTEILESTDWLGTYIPIIPVYGAELDIDGERTLEGVVRNAKDPARMYNYWASAETETIALAPRAPFIVAEGQIENYEGDWASANRKNHSVLKYKPTSLNGQPVSPPQRNAFEPAVQAITNARMLASDDLKATTGIYDSALGARSNETSGVAIRSRNVQAQTSNFHFIDNLTRSLRQAGRIMIELLPKIYDTARTARIVGDNGEQRVVKLNQPFEENGKEVIYQVDAGKYDVTVDVGPSFATKRQEAVNSMLEVTRAYPQLAQFAGDLLVKNMDWPGAQEFADRIKKTLPPNLIDDGKGAKKDIPPQIQQQIQQMSQLIEQLTGQLDSANDKIDNKTIELESKERIEMAKLETQATIELAKLQSNESLKMLTTQIAEIDRRTKMLGFDQPFPGDQSFQNPQNTAPQFDGDMSAMSEGDVVGPTGGESPGQPDEGNFNDEPREF